MLTFVQVEGRGYRQRNQGCRDEQAHGQPCRILKTSASQSEICAPLREMNRITLMIMQMT